jgi:enoyl-CoA hydratase/carnithine racemase
MAEDLLSYEVIERVAVLTMRRPPVNAVNHALIDAIHASYRRADKDASVRAIVLASAYDKAFSAGMDLDMVVGADSLVVRAFLNKFYLETLDIQYYLSKPTIAAVGGPARGAGVTLAITCDIIVCAEEADLGYPEINVGLMPAIHFAHLPRQISRHKAFEILFTGDPLPAREALEIGLVNHVVARADLVSKALDIGRRLAEKSPLVMHLARRSFMRANDLDYRRNIENQIETFCNLVPTADTQEGLRAFTEKRRPRW